MSALLYCSASLLLSALTMCVCVNEEISQFLPGMDYLWLWFITFLKVILDWMNDVIVESAVAASVSHIERALHRLSGLYNTRSTQSQGTGLRHIDLEKFSLFQKHTLTPTCAHTHMHMVMYTGRCVHILLSKVTDEKEVKPFLHITSLTSIFKNVASRTFTLSQKENLWS